MRPLALLLIALCCASALAGEQDLQVAPGVLLCHLEHLHGLGHRSFAYLAGVERCVSNAARVAAIEAQVSAVADLQAAQQVDAARDAKLAKLRETREAKAQERMETERDRAVAQAEAEFRAAVGKDVATVVALGLEAYAS